MYKKLITIMMLVVMLVVVAGCGEKKSDLTGKWLLQEEGKNPEENYFEFYSDGTGIINYSDDNDKLHQIDITWVTEEDRIKFTADNGFLGTQALSLKYNIDGNVFTLIYDSGKIEAYIRE